MMRGFTLIEVVVVLAILGITTAVALPAFVQLLDEDDLTTASREVVEVLQRARRAAIRTGREVKVTVAPDQGAYWIHFGSVAARDSVRSGRWVLAPPITLRARSERVVFRFDPKGPAFGDSLFVQSATRTAMIAVDQWTGIPYVRQ